MESIADNILFGVSGRIEAAVDDILRRQVIHWKKADLSPVSNIDLEIQATIVKILLAVAPDHNFVYEEGGDGFCGQDSVDTWVIDPIDGTDNFINKRKEFSVSVGLMHGSEFVEALLLFPGLGEKYYAAKGCGVWKNNELYSNRMPENKIPGQVVLCSKSYDKLKPVFERNGYEVGFYKCATYSLLLLLEGKAVMYHTINTKLYDVGPMSLIIREAGIDCFDQDGKSLIFLPGESRIPFFLALSDQRLREGIFGLIGQGEIAK